MPQRIRSCLKYLKYALPLAALLLLLGLELMSRSAALIFNHAMEQQDMLRGTITVEKIRADLTGYVRFENLEWVSPEGHRLLLVPDGSFRVRLWDVATQNLKSTTIQELTLNGATISMHLNEDMKLDLVRHSPESRAMRDVLEKHEEAWEDKASLEGRTEEELRRLGEKKRRLQQLNLRKQWQNFNHEGKRIKLKLNLNKCMLEVFYKERHYLLSSVHVKADVNTDKSMHLQAHMGRFGGTMVGNGMSIHGTIDFSSQPEPQCSLAILFQDVDPSSLGFGINIHDKMTLKMHFSGPVTQPVGTGTVQMAALHIPGLQFSDVKGDIHYEDARLDFTDVNATVYGGRLSAAGDYNIDTRYYHIKGVGENLQASAALPKSKLFCSVHLALELESKGSSRATSIRGDFSSGGGRYQWIPFDRLQGSFTSAYSNLQFHDVTVWFGHYAIATDAFSIVDKKLHMEPIRLSDPEGRTLLTYEARDADRKKARIY